MTLSKLHNAFVNVITSKRGAAMVEYALLAGLIAVVAITTLSGLGNSVSNSFSHISTNL